MTKFIYKDRGKKSTAVLVPGWGTDYRIFEGLDLGFNYLIPLNFSPFEFEEDLLAELKTRDLKHISIFGWSMGGFAGAYFASKHPDIVKKLILVSIRKKYRCEELKIVRDSVSANKKAYLYKFYNLCFHKKETLSAFKASLLKPYCRDLEAKKLLAELDYLETARIDVKGLKDIKDITIVHGDSDRIAPIKEAETIKNELERAVFVPVKEAGHIPFLEKGFGNLISNE